MKRKQGGKRDLHRRIAEFLSECGREFGCDHPGVPGVHEGVHFHHRLRDGKVEVSAVSGDELERLQRFLGHFREGAPDGTLERLEAELSAPGPDLEAIETSLRDDALSSASARLKRLLEARDAQLPAPVCPQCGRRMRCGSVKRPKTFTSAVGRVEVMRSHYYCRRCRKSSVPLDEHVGMVLKSVTPGMERMMLTVSAEVSSQRGREMLRDLAGIGVSRSRLDRETRRLGAEVVEFERRDAEEPGTGPATPVVAVDGTGVPVRRSETEGRQGKCEGKEAGTRESKVLRICEVRRQGKGKEVRAVAGSITQTAMIDSARIGGEGGTLSEFGARLRRESIRRGVFHAPEVVVLSDGAPWIGNTAEQVHAGQRITFILDLFHVLERLQEALREMIADYGGRSRTYGRMRSLIRKGKARQVPDVLARHSERFGKVAEFIGYCRPNLHRMRYDKYRRRDLPVGSGLIESGCKKIVTERLKKSGARWSVDGANGVMAIRCCQHNNRTADFFQWRAAA